MQRHGDACNLMALGDDARAIVAHKLEVLDRHCDEVGRDPAAIRRTVITDRDPGADPDGFLSSMEGLARFGIDEAYAMPTGPDPAARPARRCRSASRAPEERWAIRSG